MLFYREDVGEACYLKDLHNVLVDIDDLHGALSVHYLLGGKKNSESCGRDVLDVLEIQDNIGLSFERALDLCLESRCSCGVNSSLYLHCELFAVFDLVYVHNDRPFIFKI